VVSNLELEETDVLKSLLVLDFTSGKLALKNLDFFVEQSELIISSNELCTKNVSLVNDVLVVLLELFNILVGFLDDIGQLLDLIIQLHLDLLGLLKLGLPSLQVTGNHINFLRFLCLFVVSLGKSLILCFNFLLELVNLK